MKTRIFPESNYKSVFFEGKTLRMPIDVDKPVTELHYPEFIDISMGSFCSGGCPYCVDEYSLILTEKGNIPIKNIQLSDNVYVYDEKINKKLVKPVEQLHQRPFNGEIIDIELESGKILTITGNHKIFTERGWIPASEINENDILLD